MQAIIKTDIPTTIKSRRPNAVQRVVQWTACVGTGFLWLMTANATVANEPFPVFEASLTELQQALTQGELSSQILVQRYLDRIAAYDQQGPALNAILRINPAAVERAKLLDAERATQGPRGPLHGIPLIIKDNFNTADMPTSSGSVALAGFIPAEDAFHVRQLRAAGAIILAKANMDEFARGIIGLSSLGGQTKNPYDLSRTPGGSSAGTAAAVAASFAAAGLGTDTCSSIRLPAAFNNLAGLRPTKDLTSNRGLVPLVDLLDVAGPLARSTMDVALIMDAIVGQKPGAGETPGAKSLPRFSSQLNTQKLSSLRLGKLASLYGPDQQSAVNVVMQESEASLVKRGVEIVEIDSSWLDALYKEYNIQPTFQFKTEMEAYLKANPGTGFTSIESLAERGLYHQFHDKRGLSFASFSKETASPELSQSRAQWQGIFRHIIKTLLERHELDAFIYPTATLTPVKLGEQQAGSNCLLSAVSGAPSITLPAGFTDTGLPVGLELLGPAFGDEKLLAAAHAIETALDYRRPPLSTPELVRGKGPASPEWTVKLEQTVKVRFQFRPLFNELAYETRYLAEKDIYAVCLHRSKTGPIIQCVSGLEARRMNGVIELLPKDINTLKNQGLYLRLYDADNPAGSTATPVTIKGL